MFCIYWVLYSIKFFFKKEKYNPIDIFGLKFGLYKSYEPGLWFLVCLLAAVLIWILISYKSYYHGLDSQTKRYNRLYCREAVKIFSSNSMETGIDKFINIASASYSGIKIINESNKKVIKNFKTDGDATIDTLTSYTTNLFTSNGNIQLEFSYSVKPPILIGITRAITCSLSDIFGTGTKKYENNSSFFGKCSLWYKNYFNDKYYRRSVDLFFPLAPLFVLVFLLLHFFNKSQKVREEIKLANSELERANKKLEETNAKLEEFKTIHQKMYSDLLNEINQIKQPIQEYDFSWDTYIDNIFRNERHDLKNKFTSLYNEQNFNESEKYISDKLKREYLGNLEKIVIDKLNELPNIVKYGLQETSVKETLNAITMKEAAIPLDFSNGKYDDIVFHDPDISSIDIKDNEFCKINAHRLSSIIFNILANAYQVYSRKLPEYNCHIWMDIERIKKDSNDYISVSITDNAGGFPDDIIDKIYKSPVKSSKKDVNGKERNGEGTVYIGFFAKYMNIGIKAENCIAADNNKGAKVTLFIPIYTTEPTNQ